MPIARLLARWALVSATLHLGWEVAQLPLYTIYREGDAATIAFAVAHCTAGDVLIALVTFSLAAAAMRSWRWPTEQAVPGLVAAILFGVTYTAFSEWLNVSVRGSWTYAAQMPQVLGIGLAPLAQWMAVPAAALFVFRRLKP